MVPCCHVAMAVNKEQNAEGGGYLNAGVNGVI